MDNKLLYKIAIGKIPGIGAVLAKNLVSYCGGPDRVFQTNKKKLQQIPGIGIKLAESITNANVLRAAESELEYLEKNNIQAIDHTDDRYPKRLQHFSSAPYIMYYKGKGELNPDRTIAIVGTRKPSHRSEDICKSIVKDLKQYNVTVVSGLAYGIDIIAHKACVQHQVPTLGIMGNGFGRIYPSAHIHTARDMMEQGGLITEFGFEVGPDRENFPARNRIIAGMADAVLVVESAAKGGSMITAIFGNEYNKDVFAIPGRPQDSTSAGCNYLIKTQQASLCESADDIAYTMGWDIEENNKKQGQLFIDLSDKEKQIIDIIKNKENAGMDLLSYESKISQSELSSLLLNLEFKGCLRVLPGKRYTAL